MTSDSFLFSNLYPPPVLPPPGLEVWPPSVPAADRRAEPSQVGERPPGDQVCRVAVAERCQMALGHWVWRRLWRLQGGLGCFLWKMFLVAGIRRSLEWIGCPRWAKIIGVIEGEESLVSHVGESQSHRKGKKVMTTEISPLNVLCFINSSCARHVLYRIIGKNKKMNWRICRPLGHRLSPLAISIPEVSHPTCQQCR